MTPLPLSMLKPRQPRKSGIEIIAQSAHVTMTELAEYYRYPELHLGLHVYIIAEETGEFVKIGVARDVEARRADLNVGNPRNLYVLATLPGGFCLESSLHLSLTVFGNYARGEWFRIDESIKKLLKDIVTFRISCENEMTPL